MHLVNPQHLAHNLLALPHKLANRPNPTGRNLRNMNNPLLAFILIQINKHRIMQNPLHRTQHNLLRLRKTLLLHHPTTSRMRTLILPLPPVGSAITFPHTTHFTAVEGFPNIICSFLHFEQRTLMNFDDNSLTIFSLLSAPYLNLTFFDEFLKKYQTGSANSSSAGFM